MSVVFSKWRDEVLQRVRRMISILSLAEDEVVDAQESSLAWFYTDVEISRLRELADAPPNHLQPDAMLGLHRLVLLCKTLPVFCAETESVAEFYKRVESFLNDLASPTGIARLEKIVSLLGNAEPWDAGEDAKSPEAPQAPVSDPGEGTSSPSPPPSESTPRGKGKPPAPPRR